jgi:hypothetical protein
MRGVLGASVFLPPKPCSALLTMNGGLSLHINNVNAPVHGELARKAGHHAHDLEQKCVAFDPP